MSALTDGFGTIMKNLAATTGGGGQEFLTATPGSDAGHPVGDLDLSIQVSVLINQTGGAAFWHLPDGVDGQIKEINSGAPGNQSNAFIGITSTNNWGNDLLDLDPNQSARLVWSTLGGGWIMISNCQTTNSFWD